MIKFLLGFTTCLVLAVAVGSFQGQGDLGAVASNGEFIGIYNATSSDLSLRDGYGSALLTDSSGRLIVTSTSP